MDKAKNLAQKYLPDSITQKIFKPEIEKGLVLPALPSLKSDSRSTYTLASDSKLNQQGGEFNKLPADQIRAFNLAFIEELYQATRRDRPTDQQVMKWLNSLEQGATREGIYRALVLDNVYFGLEEFESELSEQALRFTIRFYMSYLGAKVNEETIKKVNSFTVKKVVSEKSLEMLEALESKPEDLYVWFAILAADLAKQCQAVFKDNKIRSNLDELVHLSWVKSVPYQHVKSELVLRIHFCYNWMDDQLKQK
jgi:hypothetical protein